MKYDIYDKCRIAIFVALVAAAAQISIPLPHGVPMTMQTMAIAFGGVILGPKRGFIVALIYVLLGAVGVPVFAGFRGGVSVIAGPTGGFILSFPIIALGAGWGIILCKKYNRWLLPAGLFLGMCINFLCGMIWFMVIMRAELLRAFTVTVLPFIIGACIEIVLISIVAPKARNLLRGQYDEL